MHCVCRVVRLCRADRPLQTIQRHAVRRAPSRAQENVEAVPSPGAQEALASGAKPSLLRPLLFTVGGSTLAFTGAALWQYENIRAHTLARMRNSATTTGELWYGKAMGWRAQLHMKWQSLTPGERMTYGVVAANCAVFACWRLAPLQRGMSTLFASSPWGRAPSLSLLFAPWSHVSPLHLCVNMYVLTSFLPPAVQLLGREHAFGFYVSAGLVAGLGSHVFKVFTHTATASVGASGAILGLLALVGQGYPDARLSIAGLHLIIPHSFSYQTGVLAIVALDTVGVLLRWRRLDHAAHLAGLVFGLVYATWGHKLVWERRQGLVNAWHKLRGDIN